VQVYRASVHGFLRLALGLSLLSSEAAESTITAALEAHPVVLGHVLDALEGFASLYDEREQARRSMLALPSAGRVAQASGANVAHGQRDLDDDDDDNEEKEEEEPTQVDLDETQLGEGEGDGKRVEAGDADSERIVRMREVVQRLRRRVR
jgi:ribosomal protein L12E/L44/L45/RPP1/RPP2